MHVLVLCTYGRDALSLRDAAMDEHLSYLRSNRDRLRFAGPLLDNDTRTASGSLAIVEGGAALTPRTTSPARRSVAPECSTTSRSSASKVRSVCDRPSWNQTARRQLYVCRWLTETGHDLHAPAEHPRGGRIDWMLEGGALLSDEGAQLIGGLFIVETVDRGHAEAVLASDVERWAWATHRTLVSRWRFGQALSEGDGR